MNMHITTSNNNTSRRLRSRLLLVACVALLTLAFAACSSSSKSSGSSSTTPAAAAADITIANLTFPPQPVSVKSGATVTVKNTDALTHTVTSDDGTSFNISVNANSTGTFTAPSKPGTYKFHCNIHSSMHGTLTVT
jgi:plastocyanin